jgi:hypothetical protein
MSLKQQIIDALKTYAHNRVIEDNPRAFKVQVQTPGIAWGQLGVRYARTPEALLMKFEELLEDPEMARHGKFHKVFFSVRQSSRYYAAASRGHYEWVPGLVYDNWFDTQKMIKDLKGDQG